MNTQSTQSGREGQAPRNYHPENIEGKTAVVSGGTTGIGRATARLLAERGAKVLIYGRDENHLKEALSELQNCGEVYGIAADQSEIEDVQLVFREADQKFGGVDILVNNAAVAAGSVASEEIEDIQYAVQADLIGYMACAHEAIARMKQKDGGHIVNIGSLSAQLAEEESDVYVAIKAGVRAWSQSLRKTVNSEGIKVSLIEPGKVATEMPSGSDKEKRAKIEKGDMLEAQDIAEAVHYCLTQPARSDILLVQIRPHGQDYI